MVVEPARLIPKRVLWGNPERDLPDISPDGHRLAYIAPDEGVLNVFVMDRGEQRCTAVTRDRGQGIRGCAWAGDARHIVYEQDRDGDENWHVHAVDVASGVDRDLTPFAGSQAQILALSPRHPDRLMVGINRDNPALHDVYEATLSTGDLVKVAQNPGFVRWVFDAELQPRGGTLMRADGGVDVQVRDPGASSWRTVWRGEPDDENVIMLALAYPIWFSADGRQLYLASSRDSNTSRLIRLDLTSGDIEVLAADPHYDVWQAVYNPVTRVPELLFVDRGRTEVTALDPAVEPDLAALRRLHRGDLEHGFGIRRDAADQTWLVKFVDASGPAAYYLYDRIEKRGTHLFDDNPALSDWPLAEVEPFTYHARDGLPLEGFVAFPHGLERRHLPAVFIVHGGPAAHTHWHRNLPEVQLLASRGYLVVRMDYRGSLGYGKAFLNAGRHEWAGKMHDDVLDAVDWAVRKGYADPRRLAVYGGSYGGYEALVAVTFSPDVFACAVSMYGPVNLQTLLQSVPPYWVAESHYLRQHAGDPETESDLLWERSPLRLADRIRVPLLLMYGANDPRVKLSEADQIRAALDRNGIPYEFRCFEHDGHGWTSDEARQESLARLEKFLAQHLGGRCEIDPS